DESRGAAVWRSGPGTDSHLAAAPGARGGSRRRRAGGGPHAEGVRAAGVDVQRAGTAGGVRGDDPPRALARPDLAVVTVRISVRRCARSVPIVPEVRRGPSILSRSSWERGLGWRT